MNNNLSNYYQFSDKIYQLNNNISSINWEIKKQNDVKQLENQVLKLFYILSISQSIKKCVLSIQQILVMTNYDKVDIEISNIIALLNEKLAKQHLQEQRKNNLKNYMKTLQMI